MPIVAHSTLPTFERLLQEGEPILTPARAATQDIRELHIGLLNMMPDAALMATERQFFRLISACNRIVQFYIHPFSFPEIPRSDETRHYIETHYDRFEDIAKQGLDALIITGANPQHKRLCDEVFWPPLKEVLDWAADHVTSVLCACLATHAAVEHFYQLERQKMPRKRWGVYSHYIYDAAHPLMKNINTRFDVPHSRWNAITHQQLASVGAKVLVESKQGGVHLATSPDGLRFIFFQGHPEYDASSLFKEYKREVQRYLKREIDRYPPFPVNYMNTRAKELLRDFQQKAQTRRDSALMQSFPSTEVEALLDNTWHDTGKAIMNNWLGLVYQLTNIDRQLPFMPGVDPAKPLEGIYI